MTHLLVTPSDWQQYQPLVVVDARALACPQPLLRLKKATKTLAETSSIHFVTSNKQSVDDVTRFCNLRNLVICDSIVSEGCTHMLIRLA